MSTQDNIKILLDEYFGLDGLEDDTPIFSKGLLDSMDVLRLITAIEKKYSITISPFDVTIEMFDTVDGIASIINSLLNK